MAHIFHSRTMHKLHRWLGLFLAAFIIFYCLSGIMMNHRKNFDYFQKIETTTASVPISSLNTMQAFIDTYKKQVARQDDPTVIRIKDDNTIELLYGSHGKTTYRINPAAGTMETISKSPRAPWEWLNRLHKVYKTANLWLFLTDTIAVLIVALTVTGLLTLKYSLLDLLLTTGGVVILAVGALLAC